MTSTYEVTFLIPCLNEQETLHEVIREAHKELGDCSIDYEILVADNGSKDASREIAIHEGARVISVPKRGYGSTLQQGLRESNGSIIIFADADCSYDLSNISKIILQIKAGSDLVVGNRFSGQIDKGAMPFLHRYLGNPVLSFIGRKIYDVSIGDFHCGLRGLRKASLTDIKFVSPGMEFASEMIVKFALAGKKIDEFPTRLRQDKRSRKPHLRTWRDGWRHLIFLLVHAPIRILLIPSVLSLCLFVLISIALLSKNLPRTIQESLILLLPNLVYCTVNLFWLAVIIAGIAKTMDLERSSTFFKNISKTLSLNRTISFSVLSLLTIFVTLILIAPILNFSSVLIIHIMFVSFSIFLSSIFGAFITHLIHEKLGIDAEN